MAISYNILVEVLSLKNLILFSQRFYIKTSKKVLTYISVILLSFIRNS